jgi:hypothetical protein
MEHVAEVREIEVIEKDGVFIVPAEIKEDFDLIPDPEGKETLIFWDKGCLNLFLENHGFVPIIVHKN